MIVPIATAVPAVTVFVPPAMVVVPAALARFTKFASRVVGLPAVPTMALGSFVELVVGLGNAPLTAVVVVGVDSRRRRKSQQANQRYGSKCRALQRLLLSQRNRHVLTILQNPRLGWGVGPALSNTLAGRM